MTLATTPATVGTEATAPETHTASTVAPILRDIARGGLTGLIVGIVGCGIGGRLVMRLAALLVPEASGASTENGNTIGTITFDGSSFLVIGGLFVGLLAGTIWVIVSPWIPGTGLRRVVITVPIAIGLGTAGLIDGDNPDFFILRHDPRVVAALIALVGIIGAMFAVVDDWLERRLPPATEVRSASGIFYLLITLLGAVLVFPLAVLAYAGSENLPTRVMGLALGAVGVATLAWWVRRVRGDDARSPRRMLVGRLTVLVAVALGYVTLVPDVAEALGLA
jgi:hypothetical protein